MPITIFFFFPQVRRLELSMELSFMEVLRFVSFPHLEEVKI